MLRCNDDGEAITILARYLNAVTAHNDDAVTADGGLVGNKVWIIFPVNVIYLYHYNLFDQCRVDISDHVECGVHSRLRIYPLCGIFYFARHRHQLFVVSLPKDTGKVR